MDYSNILHSLETQLNHRLEKLWRVFSWSSGILTSIIAAIIALKKTHDVEFVKAEPWIITAVIIIFTAYAWLMIRENLKFEGRIRDQIDKLMTEEFNYPAFTAIRPDNAMFGYKHVVLLLGLTALLTLWTEIIIK